ncbi:hypothetical protein HD806DRAFT_503658 [Xylariaceae sp. AK1471]|nr:hypothetical protein HD806DRAFT_503658 [Xylariaceae sp. AK1471]
MSDNIQALRDSQRASRPTLANQNPQTILDSGEAEFSHRLLSILSESGMEVKDKREPQNKLQNIVSKYKDATEELTRSNEEAHRLKPQVECLAEQNEQLTNQTDELFLNISNPSTLQDLRSVHSNEMTYAFAYYWPSLPRWQHQEQPKTVAGTLVGLSEMMVVLRRIYAYDGSSLLSRTDGNSALLQLSWKHLEPIKHDDPLLLKVVLEQLGRDLCIDKDPSFETILHHEAMTSFWDAPPMRTAQDMMVMKCDGRDEWVKFNSSDNESRYFRKNYDSRRFTGLTSIVDFVGSPFQPRKPRSGRKFDEILVGCNFPLVFRVMYEPEQGDAELPGFKEIRSFRLQGTRFSEEELASPDSSPIEPRTTEQTYSLIACVFQHGDQDKRASVRTYTLLGEPIMPETNWSGDWESRIGKANTKCFLFYAKCKPHEAEDHLFPEILRSETEGFDRNYYTANLRRVFRLPPPSDLFETVQQPASDQLMPAPAATDTPSAVSNAASVPTRPRTPTPITPRAPAQASAHAPAPAAASLLEAQATAVAKLAGAIAIQCPPRVNASDIARTNTSEASTSAGIGAAVTLPLKASLSSKRQADNTAGSPHPTKRREADLHETVDGGYLLLRRLAEESAEAFNRGGTRGDDNHQPAHGGDGVSNNRRLPSTLTGVTPPSSFQAFR